MRSDFLDRDSIAHIYAALTPANALVLRVCIETGLRIDDALGLRTAQLSKDAFTIREKKTGKSRRIRLTKALRADLRRSAGREWVFPHRTDKTRHRTRQAVYRDLKRAAKLFRVKCNVSPHSLRKYYAVERLRQTGDLRKVMRELNHDRIETTLIYALSDRLDELKRLGL